MKNLAILFLMLFVPFAAQAKLQNTILLNAVTTTAAGSSTSPQLPQRTFQLTCATTAGAGAAEGIVQISNDDVNWMTLGTITHESITTSPTTDGFAAESAWRYVRGKLNSISGTGANCTLVMTSEIGAY